MPSGDPALGDGARVQAATLWLADVLGLPLDRLPTVRTLAQYPIVVLPSIMDCLELQEGQTVDAEDLEDIWQLTRLVAAKLDQSQSPVKKNG